MAHGPFWAGPCQALSPATPLSTTLFSLRFLHHLTRSPAPPWHGPLKKIAARHGPWPILGWACRAWHGTGMAVLGPLLGDSPLYHSLFSLFPSLPHPVSRASLSRLLYDSLSLSTWKTTGFSTWSLRVNPSSGNLHPTRAHLLSPPLPDSDSPFSSSSFLAHYSPKDHSLKLHAHLDLSSLFPDHGDSVLLLALSSIFWREAWKYGERTLR